MHQMLTPKRAATTLTLSPAARAPNAARAASSVSSALDRGA
jgi:hypothetical protein